MAIQTVINPGVFYRYHILLSVGASSIAQLTPGTAAQLGIRVFFQVRNDTWVIILEITTVKQRFCKTHRDSFFSVAVILFQTVAS